MMMLPLAALTQGCKLKELLTVHGHTGCRFASESFI